MGIGEAGRDPGSGKNSGGGITSRDLVSRNGHHNS